MRPILFLLTAPLLVAASPESGLSYARLGQTVNVGGPKVTPLKVLEDSRCPANARCIWAGQVRLRLRIGLGSGSSIKEITLGQSLPVADGALELTDATPARWTGKTIAPRTYRFGFRFSGGL